MSQWHDCPFVSLSCSEGYCWIQGDSSDYLGLDSIVGEMRGNEHVNE